MFKNLKSLFIIEEDEPGKQPAVKKEKTGGAKASGGKPLAAHATSQQANSGKISSKFIEVLFGAMEKNNIEGFDYLEFKQSLQSLQKMPMDEATRYKSAFAMAKTMGASTQNLIDTAGHYIKVLKQEEDKFGLALAKQKKQQIGSKEQKIKKLDEAVRSKAEQIKKLTQEIESDQKQMELLKKEISNSSIKMETTKNDFVDSFNNLVSQIQSDIENMKKYLLG